MSGTIYEIRVCVSCGLRYPMNADRSFGIRCPSCLGETRVAQRKNLFEEQRRLDKPAEKNHAPCAVLLDNIRSAWNVGSILRSADGFGFDHVYLCGITPSPENEAVQKTSLGAEDAVAWSYHKDAIKLVGELKVNGWRILALEEGENTKAINRGDSQTHGNWVLILGSEVTGVDPDLLDLCDETLSIPMLGVKRSLNVSIAFGVAAFALRTKLYE